MHRYEKSLYINILKRTRRVRIGFPPSENLWEPIGKIPNWFHGRDGIIKKKRKIVIYIINLRSPFVS